MHHSYSKELERIHGGFYINYKELITELGTQRALSKGNYHSKSQLRSLCSGTSVWEEGLELPYT